MIKFLKKISPSKETIKQQKILKIFGKLINNPNLWHFNRTSVSKAFAVGLFFAWIPVPFQMPLAALGAIIFNANLALSIALVWLTNPITMPPLFFFSYIIGAKFLNLPIKKINFGLSIESLTSLIGELWKPFILGCIICAIVSSFLGYFAIKIIWRLIIIKNWKQRSKNRAIKDN